MTASDQDPEAHPKPLDILYDGSDGRDLPLPSALADFHGALRFPLAAGRPYVIANFVTTLDGVASLGIPGKAGGDQISGSNKQDVALMGLLRAAADAVVVGAGTLREGRADPLIASKIYPPLSDSYAAFRATLNKDVEPLQVIVTSSGDVEPSWPIVKESRQVLLVTTPEGAKHARKEGLDDSVEIVEVNTGGGKEDSIPAGQVLKAIQKVRMCEIVLLEGGPHLLGDFLAEGLVNEQFLTLSPQVAGRGDSSERLSLVEGREFAPDRPLWGKLLVVKRGESHLFLRYRFDGPPAPAAGQE